MDMEQNGRERNRDDGLHPADEQGQQHFAQHVGTERGEALRRQLSTLLRPRPRGDHRRAGGADRLRGPAGRHPPRQRQWSSRGRIPIRHTPWSVDPLASRSAIAGSGPILQPVRA